MRNILKVSAIVLCLLVLAAVAARGCVREVVDRFPSEQVYLRFTSPDGSTAAMFSLKHGSLRWVADVEPHYYLTLVDLGTCRVKKRCEKFVSANMRESFLSLAHDEAAWCVPLIEMNRGPYLKMGE